MIIEKLREDIFEQILSRDEIYFLQGGTGRDITLTSIYSTGAKVCRCQRH